MRHDLRDMPVIRQIARVLTAAPRRGWVPLGVRLGTLLTATVLAVLLAFPAHLAHFVLARHAVCAEHGELLHEPEAQGTPHAVGSPSKSDGAKIDANSSVEHEHEHCAFASRGHDRTSFERAPTELTIVPAIEPQRVLTAVVTVRSSRWLLFRLAPKTSPPV